MDVFQCFTPFCLSDRTNYVIAGSIVASVYDKILKLKRLRNFHSPFAQ